MTVIAAVLWGFLYRPERDVYQLGQAELPVAGEVRDRPEPGAVAKVVCVQVGRGVAAQQGSEHPGDDPASHRPELDRDVIQGRAGAGVAQDDTCASERM